MDYISDFFFYGVLRVHFILRSESTLNFFFYLVDFWFCLTSRQADNLWLIIHFPVQNFDILPKISRKKENHIHFFNVNAANEL